MKKVFLQTNIYVFLLLSFISFSQTIQNVEVYPTGNDIKIKVKTNSTTAHLCLNSNYNLNGNTILLNVCYTNALMGSTASVCESVIPIQNSINYNLIVNTFGLTTTSNCDFSTIFDSATLQFSTPLNAAVTLGSDGFSDLNSNILIYPNPATGKVFFTTKQVINQITIYDEIARSLKVISNISNNEIDLTAFDKGIYFLEIKTDLGQSIKKVMIDK